MMAATTQTGRIISLDRPYREDLPISRSLFRVRRKLYALMDVCMRYRNGIDEAQALMNQIDRHEGLLNRAINHHPEAFAED